jgi:hypothetical protein
VPQIDLDYSDRQINVDEKLSIFKEIDTATYTISGHQIPFQYSGNLSTTQSWTSTTNQITYPLIGDSISFAAKNAISNVFVDEIQYSPDQYIISGGNLILNGTPPQAGTTVVINLYSKQFYRLGTVIYSAGGTLPIQELERVGSSELYHLLSSNLTKPTTKYPIYTYKNNYINVYPQSIDFGISVNYLRKPIPPIWGMNSQITTSYQFQPSGSMNFELHSSEQTELILKILLYAGVVIRDPEIVKVAASQVQQQEINQKS